MDTKSIRVVVFQIFAAVPQISLEHGRGYRMIFQRWFDEGWDQCLINQNVFRQKQSLRRRRGDHDKRGF